jgi:hypothetical protein
MACFVAMATPISLFGRILSIIQGCEMGAEHRYRACGDDRLIANGRTDMSENMFKPDQPNIASKQMSQQ